MSAVLYEKARRDPYYRHLFETSMGSPSLEELYHAGFFDDGLPASVREHASWSTRVPTTPVGKLMRHLQARKALAGPGLAAPAPNRQVVLLTTGSFSPVHQGHLRMLEAARRACQAQGWDVLGGYISPSHDSYVSGKQGGAAALHHEHRIAILEEAVADSDWLSVCPWEARYAPVALNFTDVMDRLRLELLQRCAQALDVVYVFGSDNAGFLEAFIGQGHAVCVVRAGFEGPPPVVAPSARERCLVTTTDGTFPSSSSLVRQGALELLPHACRPRYEQLRTTTRVHPGVGSGDRSQDAPDAAGLAEGPALYLVRNDLEHATRGWGVSGEALAVFQSELMSILTRAVGKARPAGASVEMRELSLARQRALFAELQESPKAKRGEKHVLSLDACVPARAQLQLSRRFDLCSGQVFSRDMGARPGSASLPEQLRALGGAPLGWTVVDDDTASGQTVNFVRELLATCGHRVEKFAFLNELALAKQGLNGRTVLDIVDSRDFLLGAKDGGLVVTLGPTKEPGRGDDEICRAPYMLPFVNLTFRAKLPAPCIREASLALWELNASWFQQHAPGLTLREADPHSRELFARLGHTDSALLWRVCEDMLAWLRLSSPKWPAAWGP